MSYQDFVLCCPECKGTHFHIDDTHCETVCAKCGLVLVAPYSDELIFPGFMIVEK